MARIAYVNGRFLRHDLASVHVEDRGYQFSDGVYEVCEIRDSQIIDGEGHINRLERSLFELQMGMPLRRNSLFIIMKQLILMNKIIDGSIYLQVTRGVAPRNHPFPNPEVRPSLVMTAKRHDLAALNEKAQQGVSVITVPDNRWERVDIKTTGLLPNVLAKQKAIESGAFEAWFVDQEGYITEGSSTNVWIIKDGNLITRSAEKGILRGITRESVIEIIKIYQLNLQEEAFTVKDVCNAEEAFITSATSLVLPVVNIDGHVIGEGVAGAKTLQLRERFFSHTMKQTLEI